MFMTRRAIFVVLLIVTRKIRIKRISHTHFAGLAAVRADFVVQMIEANCTQG